MGPVVIDIETAGTFDALAEPVQDYLVERAERRQRDVDEPIDPEQAAREKLSLNPAAGRIVSIGLWAPFGDVGAVLVNNEPGGRPNSDGFQKYDDRTSVFFGSEKAILEAFWSKLRERAGEGGRNARYPVVTFNGRAFDGPYLMLRSTIHGVTPSRNLVGYRYNLNDHCDLQEVFTFMGALSWEHRFNLEFWCHMFGIESPKLDMDGSQVSEVWHGGDFDRLIRYSVADVQATAELYKRALPLIEALRNS